MVSRDGLRAIALGAFLFSATVPAALAGAETPDLGSNVTVTRLGAGGVAIVRPVAGAPVAAVELWFRAPSTGFGATPTPSIARLAAQTVAASKPIVGETLGALVRDAGGKLAVTVYGDAVSVAATVPATDAGRVVRAMTAAYFSPVVTPEGYRSALRDVAQDAFVAGFDPEIVVRDAVFSSLFSSGPQHFPALAGPHEIAAIGEPAVRTFAERAFRVQNATLVVSGAVDAAVAASAVAGRPDAASPDPEAHAASVVAPVPPAVARTFGEASGGYGWVGPAIASSREATALDFVADYLFRPETGVTARKVEHAYPSANLVGQFITLHDPGVFFVAYSNRDAAPLRALVDGDLATLREPIPGPAFASALAEFRFHLLDDLQTPAQVADTFGWYSVEGAPDYAPDAGGDAGSYARAAASLDPAFVAATVAKYLAAAPAVVTLSPQPAPSAKPQPASTARPQPAPPARPEAKP